MSAERRLQELLRRGRRRLVAHHLLRWGLEAASSSVILIALATLALLATPTHQVRPVLLTLLVLVTGGLFLFRALRPVLRTRRPQQLALFLEQRLPPLRHWLLSGLQLAADLADPRRSRSFSTALAEAHLAEAARRAAVVDLAQLTPWRPVQVRLLLLAGLVAALGLGLLGSAEMGRRLATLWSDEAATTTDEQTSSVPLVGDLRLRVVPPAYAGLPTQELAGSDGSLRGLRGTTVTITATTLQPAQRAFLVRDGSRQPPQLAQLRGRELTATLVLQEEGGYRFGLVTPDDATLVEGRTRPITVLPDQPPQVRLELPATDLELDDLGELELAAQATDDFGLTELRLALQRLQGEAESELPPTLHPLPLEAGPRREATVRQTLSLAALGVRSGDRLQLWVEAVDNDTVPGPQVGRSARRLITILSAQQRHDQANASIRQVWEAMIRLLATRLELTAPPPADPSTPGEARAADPPSGSLPTLGPPEQWPTRKPQVLAMLTESETLLQAVTELLGLLRRDPLASSDIHAALDGFRERLTLLVRQEQQRVAEIDRQLRGQRLRSQTLADLAAFNQRGVTELERSILTLDKLLDRLQTQDLQELGRQLLQAQDRLRELLRRYQQTQDPALRQQIEEEIRQLAAKVQDLMRRIASQMKKLPFEHVNRDALKGHSVAHQAQDFSAQLQAMQERLAQGDVQGALAELERFSASLQGMLSALKEDVREQEQDGLGPVKREMGAILQETRELEAAERKLEEETAQLERELDERQRELLEQKLGELLARLTAKTEQVQRRLNETPSRALPDQSLDNFKQSQRAAQQLRASLQAPDLDQALEVARALRTTLGETLEEAALYLGIQREASPLHHAHARLQQAAQLSQEIEQELSQLLQQAQQQRPETGRQQSERLASRQRDLAERARRAQERLRGLQEGVPLQAGRHADELGQAIQEMQQAEARLGEGRPRDARPAENRAVDRLKKVGEQMAQVLEPRRMGAQARAGDQDGEQGAQPSTSKVRIPGAAESRSPREFREELLEAMKQGAPENYRELLRGYYRELVK